ncbi:MAG: hypothetical protein AMS27_07295 [Bacteroides sp. SM23_62_1]|nr:MAG: hypothetical protein AMS27_07295 [Bacteroides sp. SM23_62_1]
MKISGFTMAKNVAKLYYPVKQAILSILPVVDEFVVALGDCDSDDRTRQEILSIGSDKIRIIDTVWDIKKYPRGMEHAHQTDIAKSHCTGDWLFYVQSDEVVHEKYLPLIRTKCEEYLEKKEIEGFLFKYVHFWGDFFHYQQSHCWYRREIRIIRNDPEIHSWESAQSFRRIPDFDGLNYRQQHQTFKLKVIGLNAYVYHYGWVRPPKLMSSKMKAFTANHRGKDKVDEMVRKKKFNGSYDYGPLKRLPVFADSHPAVMKEWIDKFDWQEELRYDGPLSANQPRAKHDLLKYRFISCIENNLLGGRRLGEFKNFILVKE